MLHIIRFHPKVGALSALVDNTKSKNHPHEELSLFMSSAIHLMDNCDYITDKLIKRN